MNKLFIWLVILVFPYFIIQVDGQCKTKPQKHECVCKDTSIKTFKEYEQKKRGIVDHIWDAGLRNWSPLATVFRNQLKELLDYDDEEVVNFAEITILFMGIYNPSMDKFPNACAQSKIINASISCLEGNNAPIVDAIENGLISDFYENMSGLIHWRSINAIDCPVMEDKFKYSKMPTFECDGNGFDYDIEAAWDLKGCKIPEKVRCTVRKLYDSCDFRDKYIANAATYALQDFVTKITKNVNAQRLFEFLSLQYGPQYPKCCCAERQKRMDYLLKSHLDHLTGELNLLADFYRSKDGCPVSCDF